MQECLEERKAVKMDVGNLLACLQLYKQMQDENNNDGEADEYLDAFVALGGDREKDGTIDKAMLIHIIKEEFGLTIDMVEFLHKMDEGSEQLNYD